MVGGLPYSAALSLQPPGGKNSGPETGEVWGPALLSLAAADGRVTLDSENWTRVEQSHEPSRFGNRMWMKPEIRAGGES